MESDDDGEVEMAWSMGKALGLFTDNDRQLKKVLITAKNKRNKGTKAKKQRRKGKGSPQ